ncbi:MAG: hypothetical protein WAZ40_03645 [Minisyncoccia bacterium]
MKIIPGKKFEKKVAKLPVVIQKALAVKLTLFIENPFAMILNNHQLHGEKKYYRSINVTGDYRILFEQYDPETVRLVDIDTHSNLY